MDRKCNVCGVSKPLDCFAKCSADKTYGVKNRCKECAAVERKAHYTKNREHERACHVAYRERNLDELRAKRRSYQAEWVRQNYERKREMDREYQRLMREKNDPVFKARAVERNQRYYNSKVSATPPWADVAKIQEFYVLAQQLSLATGVRHEVDHIIPLQGKQVTGLHVETNLQVVPWVQNRRKSNHYEPHA